MTDLSRFSFIAIIFAGVFAVASLMVGSVRLRLLPDPEIITDYINGTRVEYQKPIKSPIDFGHEVTPLMLCSSLAMAVGLIQVILAKKYIYFF